MDIQAKDVCKGELITSPGKFEGELDFVPFLWEQSLNGFTQDVGNNYFVTLDAIGINHPTLYGAQLWEDGNGFVHCVWYETLSDFQCSVTQAEKHEELNSEDSDDY